MGILKKSVIGISLMLVIVFSIMALGINIAVRQNSESLVSSIIAALEENSCFMQNPDGKLAVEHLPVLRRYKKFELFNLESPKVTG